MPLKNINFSKDLGRMADPLSPDGNLLVAAGQQQGQAAAESGAAAGKFLEQAGGMVLAAGKGYMESQVETDMRKTIDAYEARVKTDDAQLTLDLFESGITESVPAEVSRAKADIQKYKDALDQGIMTREQALLAIDKSVKEYSNTMPGWASDFRKQAATLTGIQNMGNYSEASLLAKAGASEKIRQDQLKFLQDIQQKQLTMYVEKYGVLPAGGLKGPEMARFREQLKLAADTTNLKVSLENKNLTIQQAEPRVVGYIQGRMIDGMMTISNLMQGIVTGTDPKTGKPFPPENRILFRQNILSQIGSFFEKTKAELLGFTTGQITDTTREQLMNRLNTQQKELVSSLEKQEAFDDFKKTMELNTAKAADIMNVWSIANAQLEVFRKSGMATPELGRFWLESQGDPKRAADFTKRMPVVDAYYKAVAGGGKGAADQHVRDMTGSSVDPDYMEALRKTNPGAYQTSLHQLQNHIKEITLTGWGETPEVIDARKKDFAKNLEVFGSQVRMNDVSTMREWTKLTSDPRLAQRIKELPQPAQAISPIVNKTRDVIENPEMGLMARILSLYKKVSATHKDVGFELTVDALDQVGVKYFPWKGQTGLREKAPIYGDGGQIGDDGPELKKYISMLNGSLATLNNFQETLPEELRGKLAKDLVTKFNTGYFALPVEQRVETQSTTDFSKMSVEEVKAALGVETPEQRERAMEGAARIRLQEAGGDIKQVNEKISFYEASLKIPEKASNIVGDLRKVVRRELEAWKKAKLMLGEK